MQDQRRGNGRGGRRGGAPEAQPEEDAEAEPTLESDSFAGKRASSRLDQLFADQLPWEVEGAGAPPTSEALIQRLKIPEPPGTPRRAGRPVLGDPRARRVDESFDAAGAVHRTWQAQAELRQRQGEAPPSGGHQQPAQTDLSRILRREGSAGSGRLPAPRPPLPPPPTPGTGAPPRPAVPAPLAPPSSAENPGPAAAAPEEAARSVPGLSTGRLPPLAAAPSPRPGSDGMRADTADRSLPAEAAARERLPRPDRAACQYRVVDLATDAPLGRARVELEPVDDDLLPTFNGETDDDGWYRQASLPPGRYRVTVRFRGYAPVDRVRDLQGGSLDDLALFMQRV
ncbi:MAG: carboxypeptidase-like regulatory domain-containing protein [Candidatus Sericytochromatia bacterium]|nr:carboxypeptidase-like regulatory domain-containing protein [Candidatus Sericytochromatia bacterium]